MKTKTHFAFRIDVWDAAGDNVVDHLAGLDDYLMAAAAYRAATENKPSDKITLRQGARVILRNWCDSLAGALGSGPGSSEFKSCHSDQHLAEIPTNVATGTATATSGETLQGLLMAHFRLCLITLHRRHASEL